LPGHHNKANAWSRKEKALPPYGEQGLVVPDGLFDCCSATLIFVFAAVAHSVHLIDVVYRSGCPGEVSRCLVFIG
jgi:hypothetical protein